MTALARIDRPAIRAIERDALAALAAVAAHRGRRQARPLPLGKEQTTMSWQERFSDGPPDWAEPIKYADGQHVLPGDVVGYDDREGTVVEVHEDHVEIERPRAAGLFDVKRADARGLVLRARGENATCATRLEVYAADGRFRGVFQSYETAAMEQWMARQPDRATLRVATVDFVPEADPVCASCGHDDHDGYCREYAPNYTVGGGLDRRCPCEGRGRDS